MLAILSLLVVVTLSILVTRVATLALIHTGLSRESARFQARSAFTGAGFTTAEAEQVVNHPLRRRIVMLLMLLGNAGLVTVVSSLILTFVDRGERTDTWVKVLFLVGGLLVLWLVSSSRWIDRRLNTVIDRALRRFTDLDARDYANLMHLVGEYRLVELQVRPSDWLADKTLAELELRDEGVMVLGIKRAEGGYLGAPNGGSRVFGGDTLILYGRHNAITRLDRRRKSMTADVRHDRAVEEQRRIREAEQGEGGEKQQGEDSPPEEDRAADGAPADGAGGDAPPTAGTR